MKFVPASGAASRMFRDWYLTLEQGRFNSSESEQLFLKNLHDYPFYRDLADVIAKKGGRIDLYIRDRRAIDLLSLILTEKGLNYGRLPKALIKFHTCADGSGRTPLEEHLVEAACYTKDARGFCRLHFTISAEHQTKIIGYLKDLQKTYQETYGAQFDICYSVQSTATNTIAVDLENRPFRDDRGRLIFRPGGHGALLANLQHMGGDLVFVKNIDNVVSEHLMAPTVRYKKYIGGYLISLQEEIFRYLHMLSEASVHTSEISMISAFCREKLHLGFPAPYDSYSAGEKSHFLFGKLNRPIRICGMVKNEGEPGGGPFWVDEPDGNQSLQIVEAMQINRHSDVQRALWSSGTHFNPVDLVCGLKDYRGQPFDLDRFVDTNAMCIAQKSEKGRDLKALELPGLWNGSMSKWNTVFVETPVETFNPVKIIEDLLRPSHR